ncbi:MAG: VCBS repeat-containing protein [Gemmatimonadota bacterium]|nr:MAG: VCBS repeat-containing protein [Gemmatimonadota bacterium]
MLRVFLMSAAVVLCASALVAQDAIWQQEYQASLEGEMTCAYSGGFQYAKPVLVDIDDDGDLDLFVGERYMGIDFIRNDGDGTHPLWTFVDRSFLPLYGDYFAPSFCDIDADGDQDAFIGSWDGQIRYYRNNGNSTSPIWTLETEMFDSIKVEYHSTPTFCDIDADSDYDLFLGTNEGNVHFYRNDGTPAVYSFTLVDEFYVTAASGQYGPPTFADIDNDLDYDLFVGTNRNLYFFRNEGDPINSAMTLESTRYADIRTMHNCYATFGDIDSDGDLDLLLGDAFVGLTYYKNIGNADSAAWQLADEFYATIDVTYPGYPAIADIDGDSDFDLFMGRYYDGIYMFTNAGTRRAEAWVLQQDVIVEQGSLPALCDIDGDDDLDLFCGHINGTLLFYENIGTVQEPLWADAVENYNSINTGDYCSPVFCDINDDGDFDLFVGKGDGTLSYYENTGDATSPQWAVADPFYFQIDPGARSKPEFCDIDRDGDFDLFIGKNDGRISFYRNEGNVSSPSFTLETAYYDSIQFQGQLKPVFADIDGDGDQDLFAGDEDGGLHFWRNLILEPQAIARGDCNGDGDVDLLDIITSANHILGFTTLVGDVLWAADCNDDGEIDLFDLIGIANVILGLGECEP